MVTRKCLLAQVALLGVLGVLAFPGEGLALRPVFFIQLTSTGPSPAPLTVPADLGPVMFRNTDSVTHSFSFANGWCSAELAPGAAQGCPIPRYAGDYAYTVDGTTQADLVVEPESRSVSLTARNHSIRGGSVLRLHGRLEDAFGSPPGPGQPQPIIVFGRPEVCPHFSGCGFHRVAVVKATIHRPTKRAPLGELLWQLRVRPRRSMILVAAASYQPKGGQVWERASSKPFLLHVRR